MIAKACYFLTWTDEESTVIADAQKDGLLAHELIPRVASEHTLPFKLVIKSVKEKKETLQFVEPGLNDVIVLTDYLPNSLAWPLMSEKLKFLINELLTGKEGIEWVAAQVDLFGELKPYFIPKFTKILDALNKEKTIYVPGTDHIIRPHFDLEKISDLTLFHKPLSHDLWKITSGLYVNDINKKIIQNSGLTGISFEKAAAS